MEKFKCDNIEIRQYHDGDIEIFKSGLGIYDDIYFYIPKKKIAEFKAWVARIEVKPLKPLRRRGSWPRGVRGSG